MPRFQAKFRAAVIDQVELGIEPPPNQLPFALRLGPRLAHGVRSDRRAPHAFDPGGRTRDASLLGGPHPARRVGRRGGGGGRVAPLFVRPPFTASIRGGRIFAGEDNLDPLIV